MSPDPVWRGVRSRGPGLQTGDRARFPGHPPALPPSSFPSLPPAGAGAGSSGVSPPLEPPNPACTLRIVTSFKLHQGLTLPFFRQGKGSSNEEETHPQSQSWPLTAPCSAWALKLFAPSGLAPQHDHLLGEGFVARQAGTFLAVCPSLTHSTSVHREPHWIQPSPPTPPPPPPPPTGGTVRLGQVAGASRKTVIRDSVGE